MIPGVVMGVGWGVLCLDPPHEKILNYEPPQKIVLSLYGKIWQKNGN
jgi:hypothetical protein